jgi:hypothetical protein
VSSLVWYVCVGHLSASEERMTVGLEELQDLKGVWAELSKIWQQIDELKERPWISVQPRKVYIYIYIFNEGMFILRCRHTC